MWVVCSVCLSRISLSNISNKYSTFVTFTSYLLHLSDIDTRVGCHTRLTSAFSWPNGDHTVLVQEVDCRRMSPEGKLILDLFSFCLVVEYSYFMYVRCLSFSYEYFWSLVFRLSWCILKNIFENFWEIRCHWTVYTRITSMKHSENLWWEQSGKVVVKEVMVTTNIVIK